MLLGSVREAILDHVNHYSFSEAIAVAVLATISDQLSLDILVVMILQWKFIIILLV